MQRIVNGHYADPESTRDLIGITPQEYELLVRLIQDKYKITDTFFAMSEGSRFELLASSANILNNDGQISQKTSSEVNAEVSALMNGMSADYNLLYKMLQDMNQPYPGADYSPIFNPDLGE